MRKGLSLWQEEQETFYLEAENIEECLIWKESFRKQRENVWGYEYNSCNVKKKSDLTFIATVFPGLAHTTLVCIAPIKLLQK